MDSRKPVFLEKLRFQRREAGIIGLFTAERAIPPFHIGRFKRHIIDTMHSAQAGATIYSLVEIAIPWRRGVMEQSTGWKRTFLRKSAPFLRMAPKKQRFMIC